MQRDVAILKTSVGDNCTIGNNEFFDKCKWNGIKIQS